MQIYALLADGHPGDVKPLTSGGRVEWISIPYHQIEETDPQVLVSNSYTALNSSMRAPGVRRTLPWSF